MHVERDRLPRAERGLVEPQRTSRRGGGGRLAQDVGHGDGLVAGQHAARRAQREDVGLRQLAQGPEVQSQDARQAVGDDVPRLIGLLRLLVEEGPGEDLRELLDLAEDVVLLEHERRGPPRP